MGFRSMGALGRSQGLNTKTGIFFLAHWGSQHSFSQNKLGDHRWSWTPGWSWPRQLVQCASDCLLSYSWCYQHGSSCWAHLCDLLADTSGGLWLRTVPNLHNCWLPRVKTWTILNKFRCGTLLAVGGWLKEKRGLTEPRGIFLKNDSNNTATLVRKCTSGPYFETFIKGRNPGRWACKTQCKQSALWTLQNISKNR